MHQYVEYFETYLGGFLLEVELNKVCFAVDTWLMWGRHMVLGNVVGLIMRFCWANKGLLLGYHWINVGLLLGCCRVDLWLLYGSCVIAVGLLCGCCVAAVWLLCGCYAVAMRLLCCWWVWFMDVIFDRWRVGVAFFKKYFLSVLLLRR